MSSKLKSYVLNGLMLTTSLLGIGQAHEAQAQSSGTKVGNELTGGFFADVLNVPKYKFNDVYLTASARVKLNSDDSQNNIRPYASTDARFKFWHYEFGYSSPTSFSYVRGNQEVMQGWQVGVGLEGQLNLMNVATVRPFVEGNMPVYGWTNGAFGPGGKAGARLEINLGKKKIGDTDGKFNLMLEAAKSLENTRSPYGGTEWIQTNLAKIGLVYKF